MTSARRRLALRDARRKTTDYVMKALLILLCFVAIAPLVSVFLYVLQKGLPGLNREFFTELPKPVGETGGGLANALVGSLTLVGIGSLIGIPWGLAAGIYLSEYSKGRIAGLLRFTTDLLTSIPSIIVGLFAYAVIVAPMKTFSAYAGGFALAVIMVPMVARSTEEILKLVPNHVREAGLALGLSKWRVTLQIIVRGCRSGLLTGVMLSVARVAGETAPILFTAFSNRYWARSLSQPTSSLPVQIYTYAISPFEDWHQQAWTGALVLVLFVLATNFFVRYALMRPEVQR